MELPLWFAHCIVTAVIVALLYWLVTVALLGCCSIVVGSTIYFVWIGG